MKMSVQGGLLQEKWKIQHARTKDADIIYSIHTTAIHQLGSSHYDCKEISQWIQRQSAWNYQPFIAKARYSCLSMTKQYSDLVACIAKKWERSMFLPIQLKKSWKCLNASCIWRNWRRKSNVKIWLSSLLWMLQHLSESQLCHMQ